MLNLYMLYQSPNQNMFDFLTKKKKTIQTRTIDIT